MTPHFNRRTGAFWCASGALGAAALCLGLRAHAATDAVESVSVRSTAHFDFDRAELRPADRDAILAEVGQMKGVTWQSVVATGHTDSIGPDDYNARLSGKRAAAVKAYLVGKGLDDAMIKTQAKAEATPVADNRTDDGRAKNRRTEIEFRGVRAGTAAAAPR